MNSRLVIFLTLTALVMFQLILAFCFLPIIFARRSDGVIRSELSKYKSNLRVTDGHDLKHGEYSFVVVLFEFIEYDDRNVRRCCTASMIAKSWVLTAAHCVDYLLHKDFFVWYGNYTMSPLETNLFSKVLKVFIHPAYRILEAVNLATLIVDNDISLLRVRHINLQSYGRISSVDYKTLTGLPVTFVGGGFTNKPGVDAMRPLQVGEAAIITCDMNFKDITRHLICVTPKCSKRLHRTNGGDSGGPLICYGQIIGVLSYGEDDEYVVKEGYTPISPYIDWIQAIMYSEEQLNLE